MGYTNYFYTNENSQINLNKWNEVISIFNKLYNNRIEIFDKNTLSEIPNMQYYTNLSHEQKLKIVEDYDNQNEPIFTDEYIKFNGLGEHGHETFYMERVPAQNEWKSNKNFNFTKTNRKPYDFWVIGILSIMKSIMPNEIKIGSDGSEHDINPILKAFDQAIVKLGIDNKFYPKNTNDLFLGFYEDYNKHIKEQKAILRKYFIKGIDEKYSEKLDTACMATQNNYEETVKHIKTLRSQIAFLNATLAGNFHADENTILDKIQSICDKYEMDSEELINDFGDYHDQDQSYRLYD